MQVKAAPECAFGNKRFLVLSDPPIKIQSDFFKSRAIMLLSGIKEGEWYKVNRIIRYEKDVSGDPIDKSAIEESFVGHLHKIRADESNFPVFDFDQVFDPLHSESEKTVSFSLYKGDDGTINILEFSKVRINKGTGLVEPKRSNSLEANFQEYNPLQTQSTKNNFEAKALSENRVLEISPLNFQDESTRNKLERLTGQSCIVYWGDVYIGRITLATPQTTQGEIEFALRDGKIHFSRQGERLQIIVSSDSNDKQQIRIREDHLYIEPANKQYIEYDS